MRILSAILLVFSLLGTGHLLAGSTERQRLLQLIEKHALSPKDMCGKGSIFSGIDTLRAQSGKYCADKVVGAFALLLCAEDNLEGFTHNEKSKPSKCFDKAKIAVGVNVKGDVDVGLLKEAALKTFEENLKDYSEEVDRETVCGNLLAAKPKLKINSCLK